MTDSGYQFIKKFKLNNGNCKAEISYLQDASDRETDEKSITEEMGSVEDLSQDQQQTVVTMANTSDANDITQESNSLSSPAQILKVKLFVCG